MKIILVHPQIPQNTGNIARTAAVTGSGLVLVRPFGFSTSDRWLKRSGLDYWEYVSIEEIDDLPLYLEEKKRPFVFLSSRGKTPYTEIPFTRDMLLIFGSETAGLAPEYWERWPERFFTIPMRPNVRSLNLSTSAAIVLYEGMRQLGFDFQLACETKPQPIQTALQLQHS